VARSLVWGTRTSERVGLRLHSERLHFKDRHSPIRYRQHVQPMQSSVPHGIIKLKHLGFRLRHFRLCLAFLEPMVLKMVVEGLSVAETIARPSTGVVAPASCRSLEFLQLLCRCPCTPRAIVFHMRKHRLQTDSIHESAIDHCLGRSLSV